MSDSLRGTLETILVVDDEPMIVDVVARILESANFLVLKARSGKEAQKIAAEHSGEIALLLSDVRMPEISGPDLGELLKKTRPKMHVMFMSGYPGGELLVLNYGWAFIAKPFLGGKLVEMVNVVLHSPDRSQASDQFDTRKEPGRGLTGKE